MNPSISLSIRKFLVSSPLLAAAAYAGVVILLLVVVAGAFADVLAQRAEVEASADMLDKLAGHRSLGSGGPADTVAVPPGSPFLEGSTVTVAGAVLLQRVSAAVTRLGGNVLSSQVDLDGTQSKAGFVSIIASCDIEQAGLQQLLYDIEAGMPFLFVDQLVVQAPGSFSGAGDGKLRILLAVSGQWQGAK
jgi:general secretion pathway protein M